MEAVPRLPMLSFDLKVSTDNVDFGPALKQYIASFYNEDPDSYNSEINNLESLRSAAVRPTIDVAGCQLLKKYYCQLHFLKSRFPMNEMQAAAVYFSWKDGYSNMSGSIPDVRFELMCVLYNIGALHTQLGAIDSRTNPDGLKMACTHFQCAAWAFQTVKETYHQMVPYLSSIDVVHFMQQVCLAQAQECILEKSMMDNRKATITAKVAVQVVDYYRRALNVITSGDEDSFTNFIGGKTLKEWSKYLNFKVSYHKCVSLLFQGQQAEEQQKMGERVAFYQAACDQLEEARKLSNGLKQQKDLMEAIAFTTDVVEGKRKAAKNENEFIYHEEVPEKNALQEVKGAALVKGTAFNINDLEVSGPDIFARLVPMEAHEASSLYSERKAQKLRQLGELVESKDQALAEFMSSLQLEVFTQMRLATGLSQDLVDRAAALSAKPNVTQEMVAAMGSLSNSFHEVESMLNEIQELLKEEEESEKRYQELMGKRPPGIIATDLAREASKYKEAHSKANDSNMNLHKVMTSTAANLKILAQPLRELQKQIPSVELPNPNVDESSVKEIENLIGKVEEMRNQRAMLWSQFREALHKDDITSVLVTRQADQPLDLLFQRELDKHHELTSFIEQNVAAQENILQAFVDAYARSVNTRRYLQDVINKRNATVNFLISSFDTHEDLLAKANKGIDFYNKLETNVAKLLQRIKSACKVQQEEREQFLQTNVKEEAPATSNTPKLRDYLDTRKKVGRYADYAAQNVAEVPAWPRPTPLGSEVNDSDQNLADRMSTLRTGYSTPTSVNQQAFTFTTDTYQPISSITQNTANHGVEQHYLGSSLGNYSQASQPSLSQVSQHTLGSYTQVAQPNMAPYTQNYNYNQSNLSYGQGGTLPASYIQDNQLPMTYAPVTQYQPTANYQQPSQTSIIYQNPQLGSYAQPTSYQTDSTYYPTGYGPSASQMSDQTYNYPQTFGDAEYATSVRPDMSTISGTSTYSSPTPDIKSSTASTNNYVMSNGHNYPSYDSTGQYQYYYSQNSYDYGAYAVPATTKESNVDLLTGLDFTVSQAPLIPQQKLVTETPAEKNQVPKAAQSKEEVPEPKIEKVINRKPLNNVDVVRLFGLEVDKYEKFVDLLTSKTLSGPTSLELKWKEVVDKQDVEKRAISVARCYPMKNRYADILPYDYSRVELKGAKDDYINASHVKDLSYYSAPFIVTQAPLSSTISDFWTMIREQQVELIVSLLGDSEVGSEIYWPSEKGRDLTFPGMIVSLVSVTPKPNWVERLVSLSIPEKRDSRVLMHLQFTSWPGSLFPTNPDPFVTFVSEVANLFLQQRSTLHPLVVHCSSGIGRSGLLCLLTTAILEVTSNPASVPDLVSLTVKLGTWRRNVLRDREHLKFAYEAFLAYMKLVIAQGNSKKILNEVGSTKPEEKKSTEIKQEITDDPLNSLDPFWASKKGV